MRLTLSVSCIVLLAALVYSRTSGGSDAAVLRCAVTTPTTDLAPTPSPTDGYAPFGPGGIWYHNTNRTMWAHPWQAWRAKRSIKVGWIRPAGAMLHVMGRRLDRHADPLQIDLPCCYPGHFQASGLTFPSSGCWVVRARADRQTLRFVVAVPPGRSRPKAGAS